MTLFETDKIDIVAEEPDGTVVLGIVAAEGWRNDRAEREQLARKLTTYISYLHTPEYRKRFGSKDATIYLVTDTEPPPEITGLLQATEDASGVPIRVQNLGAGTDAGTPEEPRGLPKDVSAEPVAPRRPAPQRPAGQSAAPVTRSARLQKVRARFALLALPLAVLAGVVAWERSGSIALGLFVFVMANYIVSRGVADVVTDAHKVRRALYFLLAPSLSTIVLVLAWWQWQIVWLAVVLGFFGGLVFHGLLAPRLFPGIHQEEAQDSAERMKEAFMRQRAAHRGS